MVKKTQSIEGKNPTFFLAFTHPDWFLPYIYVLIMEEQIYKNTEVQKFMST